MAACKGSSSVQQAPITQHVDSAITTAEVRQRNVPITIPGAAVERVVNLPCPVHTPVATKADSARNGHVLLTWGINQQGQLHLRCQADSLLRVVAVQDSLIYTLRTRTTTHTITVPQPIVKYKVPKWVWWLVAFNVIGLAWRYRHGLLAIANRLFKRHERS